MPETPPRAPGWYRVTKDGWEFVADESATVADVAEKYPRIELVLVESDGEQVSMW